MILYKEVKLLDFTLFDLLKLDHGECMIFGTTIARILDIIPTPTTDFDIDIAIIDKSWIKFYNLFKNIHIFKQTELGGINCKIGKFDIYNDIGFNMNKQVIKNKINDIDFPRVSYISLEDLVKWKLKMNREKDRIHAELIKQHLNKIN